VCGVIYAVRHDKADLDSKIQSAVEYTVDAIKTKIPKLIKEPFETFVVCEATGGLEYLLVDAVNAEPEAVVVACEGFFTCQHLLPREAIL